jgi:xanthine dehydrogenase YagR molybdenum-binding subunit
MIQTTINGELRQLEDVRPDETVAEWLRGAGLTGTKIVCGTGTCGACTVLVDGVPMTSCLLPVHHIADRQVQTVEAFGPEALHPVQRALMACDGLQCGFCTPGFVMSGIAFYDSWRKDHPGETPSREEVATALSGNLCRCGAHLGIYEAMKRACTGEFDSITEIAAPRYEALEKVTGRARYTIDQQYPGQLEGVILRSIHPHAKVLSIDASEALAVPGVFAFTELLESDRIVRYTGQEIGALAAVDIPTARSSLGKIKVEYQVYPAAVGMQAAQADGASVVYPGFFRKPPTSAEGLTFPGRWQKNLRIGLLKPTAKSAGKAQRMINQARTNHDPNLIERTFHNAIQVHTAFEPHVCVVKWEDPRHLTVHLSTQSVHASAHIIAEHFDLDDENVTLVAEHIGGGFGGKQGVSIEGMAAITLARLTEHPVRVFLNRFEELSYAGYRPGAEVHLSILTNDEGQLQALSTTSYGDTGISIGSGVSFLLGASSPPNAPRNTEEFDVVSHTPPGTPFRGPNGPQALWALEQIIDEVAHHLGQDPIQLRKCWYPEDELRHKLLDWAADLSVWQNRDAIQGDTRFKRGVGLSVGAWPLIYNGNTQVTVGVRESGIYVQNGTQDIGTGSRTLLAMAAAEGISIAPDHIQVMIGSSNAPLGPASAGSQTANSVFGPAFTAAQKLKAQLLTLAQEELQLHDPTVTAGGIQHAEGLLTWDDLVSKVGPFSITETRGPEASFMPLLDLLSRDEHAGSIGQALGKAVTVTEVLVDTHLGKITPLGVWMGVAAGRIFAPTLARNQVCGGIIQGLGYALYEARQIDEKTGNHLTTNLDTYKIPGISDVPPIEVFFLEGGFEEIRSKGFGIAELTTIGVAASVGNAVFHATGWRPLNTPILPRDVLMGTAQNSAKGGRS